MSRELIREILETDDYEVIEAGDGREALEKIREHQPDLALLDIQMPVLDGNAVIRRDSRGSPIFAASGGRADRLCHAGRPRKGACARASIPTSPSPLTSRRFRAKVAELLGKGD